MLLSPQARLFPNEQLSTAIGLFPPNFVDNPMKCVSMNALLELNHHVGLTTGRMREIK